MHQLTIDSYTMQRYPFCLFLVLWLIPPPALAERALIAVASNFSYCFQKLKSDFESDTTHRVQASFGSTGALYAQIKNGAPFDAFLAADEDTPKRLAMAGRAVSESRFTYAVGRLQLWSNSYSLDGLSVREVLSDQRLNKLAIAKPLIAPYGLAAKEVLGSLDLLPVLRHKLVYGENVSQTLQFVSSKNAQLGFIAKAQLRNISAGQRLDVPSTLHSAIRQNAVLLAKADKNPAAIAFLHYLRTDSGRANINDCGYDLP